MKQISLLLFSFLIIFSTNSVQAKQTVSVDYMHGFDDIYMQMQQHHWNRALVVTHGGVIKLLTCLARHLKLDDLLTMPAELGKLYSLNLTQIENKIHFSEKIAT